MNAADFPPVPMAEAIERLAAMPAFLQQALQGRSAAKLRQRAGAPGDFALVEHACHLRDLEREGYLVRVRRILGEECPALADFPGGTIAIERDYPSQDAHAAAADFSNARAEVLAIVGGLERAQLCRRATFDGRDITLGDLVAMMVEHDRGHRAEIEALTAALADP